MMGHSQGLCSDNQVTNCWYFPTFVQFKETWPLLRNAFARICYLLQGNIWQHWVCFVSLCLETLQCCNYNLCTRQQSFHSWSWDGNSWAVLELTPPAHVWENGMEVYPVAAPRKLPLSQLKPGCGDLHKQYFIMDWRIRGWNGVWWLQEWECQGLMS